MPAAENPDGTLWIDIRHTSEVKAVRRWLSELGVPVTALVADPACEAPVKEVAWGDLYPTIVPRNGPEPGVIVRPTAIPPDHTLLLAVKGAPSGREFVVMLALVRGPAPPRYGKGVTRARPPAKAPRRRAARPPGPVAGGRVNESQDRSRLMLRTDGADQQTQKQLWLLAERLAGPLRAESRSWVWAVRVAVWAIAGGGLGDPRARERDRRWVDSGYLHTRRPRRRECAVLRTRAG